MQQQQRQGHLDSARPPHTAWAAATRVQVEAWKPRTAARQGLVNYSAQPTVIP